MCVQIRSGFTTVCNSPLTHLNAFFFFFFLSRHFVEACGHGLGINERLIKEDQQEYHDEMKANYRDLARELSIIMHEQVSTVSVLLKYRCNYFLLY